MCRRQRRWNISVERDGGVSRPEAARAKVPRLWKNSPPGPPALRVEPRSDSPIVNSDSTPIVSDSPIAPRCAFRPVSGFRPVKAGETVRLTLFTGQIWTREITSSLLRHPPSVIPLLGEGEGVIGESRTPTDSLWGCHSASPAVQTRFLCEFELPIRPNVRFASPCAGTLETH